MSQLEHDISYNVAGRSFQRQSRAIDALLRSSTLREASELCGVSPRSLQRFLRRSEFVAALNAARVKAIEDAVNLAYVESKKTRAQLAPAIP